MNAPPGAAPARPLDPNHAPQTRLYGSRLILAWLVGGAWVSFSFGLFAVSLPGYLAQFQTPCLATGPANNNLCMDGQLSPAATTTLQHLGLSVAVYATLTLIVFLLEMVLSCALAVLLVARRPHDWMALLVALMLATIVAQHLINPFSLSHAVGTALAVELATILDQLFVFSITLVFYIFPDGRFVPRWTRWMVIVGLGLSILLLFFPQYTYAWTQVISGIAFIMLVVSLVIAQVYRYLRVSTQLQRQQTKVVVYCVAVSFLVIAGVNIVSTVFPSSGQVGSLYASLANTLFSLLLFLIPVSIAIAILRYRLWDIDTLINRTLVYGLLTSILGALYAVLILGLESMAALFTKTAGQNSVVLVVSTLAIAALALPVRRRIQNLIDRRFYRRKYDAEKALAAFSDILRNEVELEHLRAQVLAVVQDTVQPVHASLWLRETDSPGKRADITQADERTLPTPTTTSPAQLLKTETVP
jgi:hypothetical protein